MVEVFGGVDHRGASHLAAVVVDEDITHNGEDPAFEVDVVNIFRLVVKHF